MLLASVAIVLKLFHLQAYFALLPDFFLVELWLDVKLISKMNVVNKCCNSFKTF